MTTKIKSGAITAVLVALIIVLLTSFAYTFNPEEYKKDEKTVSHIVFAGTEITTGDEEETTDKQEG